MCTSHAVPENDCTLGWAEHDPKTRFCMRFWRTFSQDRGFPKGGCFLKSNYMVYLNIYQYMNRLKTKLK